MKLVVFLGSGVSLSSGMPSVKDIMGLLLHGPFIQDGSARFSVRQPREKGNGEVARIRRFLRLLKEIDTKDRRWIGLYRDGRGRYSSSGAVFRGETSYEDLFALCQVLKLWATGQSDDALTTPFLLELERKAGDMVPEGSHKGRLLDLCRLADGTARYIQWVVVHALTGRAPVGLDLILDLARETSVSQLSIVTLNHDTLVEQLLSGGGVPFIDGFSGRDGDVRWFDESTYDNPSKVRLIKLHGSMSWFSFTRAGRQWPAVLEEGTPLTARDGAGNHLKAGSQTPSFLAGGQKDAWYSHGLYADLHFRFHELLRRNNRLVMSGYGWGDLGITNRIDRWLDRDADNRVVLLHENPADMVDRSKILAMSYDSLVQTNQLVPVRKWLSATTLDDIAPALAGG